MVKGPRPTTSPSAVLHSEQLYLDVLGLVGHNTHLLLQETLDALKRRLFASVPIYNGVRDPRPTVQQISQDYARTLKLSYTKLLNKVFFSLRPRYPDLLCREALGEDFMVYSGCDEICLSGICSCTDAVIVKALTSRQIAHDAT